jgi:hypothetical protein
MLGNFGNSFTVTCILNTFITSQFGVFTRFFCEFLGHSWQENSNMSLLQNASYIVFFVGYLLTYSSTFRTDGVGPTSLRNVCVRLLGYTVLRPKRQYYLKTCLGVKLCGQVKLRHSWCNASVSMFIFQAGTDAKLSK